MSLAEHGADVKVTRARMVVELADGSALYWEARDPTRIEVEHEPWLWIDGGGAGPVPADISAGYLPSLLATMTLRIHGSEDGRIRLNRDSGEIPPELAERALDWIDGMKVMVGPLQVLRPYLARIAGKTL